MNVRHLLLAAAFIAVLLVLGEMRRAAYAPSVLSGFSQFATPLYVAATIAFAFVLTSAGVRHRRVGFGLGFKASHIAIGLAAFVAAWVAREFSAPVLDQALGMGRNLERFAGVPGSMMDLLVFLALSWTVAAFGEEIAFRILLMRALASGLGDGVVANGVALIVQAAVFGLAHAYQGQMGVAQTFISGLIYGAAVLAARGAVWPAAIAHGLGNTVALLSLYGEG